MVSTTTIEHEQRKHGRGVYVHLPPLFLTNSYFRPSGTSPAQVFSFKAQPVSPLSLQTSQIKKEGGVEARFILFSFYVRSPTPKTTKFRVQL